VGIYTLLYTEGGTLVGIHLLLYTEGGTLVGIPGIHRERHPGGYKPLLYTGRHPGGYIPPVSLLG